MEILINLLNQLLFTVGFIAGLGLLIALLRKLFLGLSGTLGYYILLIFGIVGTPIHELSHALMCLIFGHKVTEIKLFSPGSADAALGYVNHSYNPKNIYHRVGNFFIGVAPIICGSCVILGAMYLLLPDIFGGVISSLSTVGAVGFGFENYFLLALDIFKILFAPYNFGRAEFWIFIILALMISSHMELSFADIKGGADGFVFITLILLLLDTALYFTSPEMLSSLTGYIISLSLSLVGFLSVSLLFLFIMVIIAFVLKIIF